MFYDNVLTQVMLFILAVTLLSCYESADINEPKWKPIKSGVQKVAFPIKDTQLQIKSFRPSDHDPDSDNSLPADKSTSMVMMFFLKGERVATVVWNTIPYREGRDVTIFGCQATYRKYNSDPCNGDKEQVWTWQFTPKRATLKCHDEVQYEMDFSSASLASCKRVGKTDVDEIKFTNMAGFYYRGLLDQKAPEQPQEQPQEQPEDLSLRDHRPTCGCWNKECGYCSDLDCAVKYNISAAVSGVTVRSELQRSKTVFKKIMLFNSVGARIGYFMINRKAVFLEGCIHTRAPRLPIPRGEAGDWTLSLVDAVLKVEIGGVAVVDSKLRKGCADYYSDVQYFSFKRMGCDDSFKVLPDVMKVGTLMDGVCSQGTCIE